MTYQELKQTIETLLYSPLSTACARIVQFFLSCSHGQEFIKQLTSQELKQAIESLLQSSLNTTGPCAQVIQLLSDCPHVQNFINQLTSQELKQAIESLSQTSMNQFIQFFLDSPHVWEFVTQLTSQEFEQAIDGLSQSSLMNTDGPCAHVIQFLSDCSHVREFIRQFIDDNGNLQEETGTFGKIIRDILSNFTVPIGMIVGVPYSSSLGDKWLLCDGSLYNASDYPELYQAIGRRYCLQQDPQGYFRVPDLRGRYLRGTTDGNGKENLEGGENFVQLKEEHLPKHDHGFHLIAKNFYEKEYLSGYKYTFYDPATAPATPEEGQYGIQAFPGPFATDEEFQQYITALAKEQYSNYVCVLGTNYGERAIGRYDICMPHISDNPSVGPDGYCVVGAKNVNNGIMPDDASKYWPLVTSITFLVGDDDGMKGQAAIGTIRQITTKLTTDLDGALDSQKFGGTQSQQAAGIAENLSIASAGGDKAHENRPPALVVKFWIRAKK